MQHRVGIGLMGLVAIGALGACTATTTDSGAGGASGTTGTGGSSAAGAAGSTAGGAAGSSAGGTSAGGTSAGGAGGGAGAGACEAGPPCGMVDGNGTCDATGAVQFCQAPPPGTKCDAILQTKKCQSYEKCGKDAVGIASCQLATACVPSDVSCKDTNTVQTCAADGSAYTPKACDPGTVCKQPPGKQATCLAVAGATMATDTLSGQVNFEYRSPTKTGPSALKTDAAWLQFIAVYEGTDYIGSAITDNDGKFTAPLTKPATANTTVYVYTLDFDPVTKNPLVGVVHNTDPNIDTLTATKGYWFWSNKGDACGIQPATVTPDAGGKHTMATLTVPESCGSGAIRVFQWIRYGMNRLGNPDFGLMATKGKKQDTIAVFWEPGEHSACGACFLGKQAGGATVKLPGAPDDTYDTLIQISGSNDYPTQWSYSVLSHETGHWVMANYSRSPGEGGPHYVAQASIPGLAYSEGWATAFGQGNLASAFGPTDPDNPLYIDTQQGTTFWVDISQAQWTNGALDLPDPNGAIDQKVNENVISDMIWHLWQGQGPDSGTYQNVGDEKIFTAFQTGRLTDPNLNRGYPKLDLIDFYDAVVCSKVATDAQVKTTSDAVTYPWGVYNQAKCQ